MVLSGIVNFFFFKIQHTLFTWPGLFYVSRLHRNYSECWWYDVNMTVWLWLSCAASLQMHVRCVPWASHSRTHQGGSWEQLGNISGGCPIWRHSEEVGRWIQTGQREMTTRVIMMCVSADWQFSNIQNRKKKKVINFKRSVISHKKGLYDCTLSYKDR